jgi:hypothetical protein
MTLADHAAVNTLPDLMACPTQGQSREFLVKAKDFTAAPEIRALGDGHYRVANRGAAGRTGALHGFRASLLLIDEAADRGPPRES